MSVLAHGLRQSLTIARRDLVAMVLTPTFLLFLLSPLLMIGFGVLGSLSASSAASAGMDRQRMIIVAPAERAALIAAADRELRSLYASPNVRPPLIIENPRTNADPVERFHATDVTVTATLEGSLDSPQIRYIQSGWADARYLSLLAEQVLRMERAGTGSDALSEPVLSLIGEGEPTVTGRGQAAYFAALGIFFLTLMLSGQAVGAMAEERANKVIEVLAAAVPLESVFFGKLLGTFGSALLFVAFWGTLISQLPKLIPEAFDSIFAELGTAVGPIFPLLFVGYFAMAYLLQSAVFLGLGAQAATQREIQMLSLPITVFQFGMLGLGAYAANNPDTLTARIAEIFPFSSPLAMVARAANAPEIWPHLLALLWQGLWVAITITVAARMFRKGVLNSGSPGRWWRRRTTIDTTVN